MNINQHHLSFLIKLLLFSVILVLAIWVYSFKPQFLTPWLGTSNINNVPNAPKENQSNDIPGQVSEKLSVISPQKGEVGSIYRVSSPEVFILAGRLNLPVLADGFIYGAWWFKELTDSEPIFLGTLVYEGNKYVLRSDLSTILSTNLNASEYTRVKIFKSRAGEEATMTDLVAEVKSS